MNYMETSTSLAVRTNVQIVQEGFNHFGKGNIQGILDLCADDVIWDGFKNPDVPFSGTFYGKEGVQEFFKRLGESVTFTHFEPREFFSDGNNVFVTGHEEAQVKETGNTYSSDWCMHFRLQDNRFKHFFAYTDTYTETKAFRKV